MDQKDIQLLTNLSLWVEKQALVEGSGKTKYTSVPKDGKKYVQRDLEDQIAEELACKKQKYMSTSEKKKIVIQDVLELLKKGYTRYEKDNKGIGSIQSHYGLNASQVQKLFASQPKLKQKKTISPKFEVIDLEEVQIPRPVQTNPETNSQADTTNSRDQLFS